jgi:hypothetical protein
LGKIANQTAQKGYLTHHTSILDVWGKYMGFKALDLSSCFQVVNCDCFVKH